MHPLLTLSNKEKLLVNATNANGLIDFLGISDNSNCHKQVRWRSIKSISNEFSEITINQSTLGSISEWLLYYFLEKLMNTPVHCGLMNTILGPMTALDLPRPSHQLNVTKLPWNRNGYPCKWWTNSLSDGPNLQHDQLMLLSRFISSWSNGEQAVDLDDRGPNICGSRHRFRALLRCIKPEA